jgi:hypothetical protein
MSWSRQVVHVMMKDLRENSWAVGVYIALAAVATANAFRTVQTGAIASLTMPMIILFGMITVASLIQGDSPIRADAFWASRPLTASAVLVAKLLLAVIVVIGVAALGQSIGLVAHHLAPRDVPGALVWSILDYGRWLLIAMVLAAVTRDLRTFIVALLVVPAVYLANVAWFDRHEFDADMTVRNWVLAMLPLIMPVIFATGGAALLAYLYSRRDARIRTSVAALLVIAAGINSPASSTTVGLRPGGVDVVTDVEEMEEVDSAALKEPHTAFTLMPRTEDVLKVGGVPMFSMTLTADSLPSTRRLQLIGATALFHMRNGSVLRERVEASWNPTHVGVHAPSTTVWLEPGDPHPTTVPAMARLSDSVRRAVNADMTSLEMDGQILVSVPAFVDTLSLRGDSVSEHDGVRTTVSNWSYGAGTGSLTVRSSMLSRDGAPLGALLRANPTDADYALVNTVRHEAIPLVVGEFGTQEGWIVLPGVQTTVTSAHLNTSDRNFDKSGNRPDDAWFRDARLTITYWKSRESYPVHSEVAVPLRPNPLP